MKKNKAAQELGRLALGKPKTLTINGIEARRKNLVKARAVWAKQRLKKSRNGKVRK